MTPFLVFAGQKRLDPFIEEQVIVCWAINGRLTANAAIVIADFCIGTLHCAVPGALARSGATLGS
jgi:hypothetical protein